ncbi:hypothetical protein HETIRDRAFT_318077, partial [Heterobasidion irregulare TC 32-1]
RRSGLRSSGTTPALTSPTTPTQTAHAPQKSPANIQASYGRYERLRADESDYDYVAHTSFNGPTKIIEHREADIEQPQIADGEFYVRRAYSRLSKCATVSPHPHPSPSRSSQTPSNPHTFDVITNASKWTIFTTSARRERSM